MDCFLAPSRFLKDRFLDWGLPAAKLQLMPNAVAPLALMQDRPRARRDRFAFFGTLAPHKGVLTLLEAATQLKAEGAELRIAFHGGLRHPEPAFRTAFETALAEARPSPSTPAPMTGPRWPAGWPMWIGSWCPRSGGRMRRS